MQDFIAEKLPVHAQLNDGTPCLIRLMEEGDEPAFRDFHEVLPEEEQLFVRSSIKDGSLFREWMADPESDERLPLLAFVDDRLAATGFLRQRMGGWKRHIGMCRFLTRPDFRGLGLLDRLLEVIIDLSGKLGLERLESELNGERRLAIESMATAGFDELVRLPGYVRDMNAESHDYVLMGMSLVASYENLGAGD
jgi:GNAT superfamily N-acetyltransferase